MPTPAPIPIWSQPIPREGDPLLTVELVPRHNDLPAVVVRTTEPVLYMPLLTAAEVADALSEALRRAVVYGQERLLLIAAATETRT